MNRRRLLSPRVVHAARVSLAATLVVAVLYLGCVALLNRIVAARLTAEVDARLTERLADVARHPGLLPASQDGDDDDIDAAPVFLWLVRPGTGPVALRSEGPRLPRSLVPVPPAGGARRGQGSPASQHAATVQLGPNTFRLLAVRSGSSVLVAGQSLAEQQHIQGVLLDGELIGGPLLLLVLFAGSLIIGLRALAPVEQSRRRQLEFTADASHELRTPLSVISAETALALSAERNAASYRDALARIDRESRRLRRIVEDMLWLARFDSRPPPPGDEPLDLVTIARECADRFRSVAGTAGTEIEVVAAGAQPAWISAPPEWIDRLAGVLTDNACRYAAGGQVRISVTARGSRVSLAVEDSGPGIRPGEAPRLFDRFHRAAEGGGGAGLGLAIADSIVSSTGGHWRIGESVLGGARFEVSWRRSRAQADHESFRTDPGMPVPAQADSLRPECQERPGRPGRPERPGRPGRPARRRAGAAG